MHIKPVPGRENLEKELLPAIVSHYLAEGNAISMWRCPDNNVVNLLIAADVVKIAPDSVSIEDSKPGFIISSFNPNDDKYFLPADHLYIIADGKVERKLGADIQPEKLSGSEKPKFHYRTTTTRKVSDQEDTFIDLVQKSIHEIEGGRFEKVVASRQEQFDLPPDSDLLAIFDKLCERYPQAFVTLTSTPVTGTWIGASPELLVHVSGTTFKTAALASTKLFDNSVDLRRVSWNQKEIEEQALVCRYIIGCFKKIRLREYDEQGPRTFRAGNLLHLKTDYTVDMQATHFPQLGSVMLKLLHPTSAVCGMPLQPAIDFLVANENYSRQLYSGYSGPVNIDGDSSVFVNLRCMQVDHQHATLYAGAGITIDSIPEEEWAETVNKMNTLKQIILS